MKRRFISIALMSLMAILLGCTKLDFDPKTKIEVLSDSQPGVSKILAKGNVIELSSKNHSEFGFCFSTGWDPDINDSKVTAGVPKVGSFSAEITGLTGGTYYYIRAYCKEGDTYVYSHSVSISTIDMDVSTSSIFSITNTTAISGGYISSNSYTLMVTARGVCWSTTPNPTILLTTKTLDGSGTGSFTSNITGLTAGTTYHIRAYATHSLGTEYGEDKTFTTTGLVDIDGNAYTSVTIGTQTWLKENLKTTKYRDGTAIANITDNAAWTNLTSGGYCWYSNNISNKSTYGALYNYYAVVDSRSLCPTGWHIPSDTEWTTLVSYLGGESYAGGKLKETGTTHWTTPNTGATNSSGFTALPGGARYTSDGLFHMMGSSGAWWSVTGYDANNAWMVYLDYDRTSAGRDWDTKNDGLSVRCIKD